MVSTQIKEVSEQEGEYPIIIKIRKPPAARKKKNTQENVQENHAENKTLHEIRQPKKTGLPF